VSALPDEQPLPKAYDAVPAPRRPVLLVNPASGGGTVERAGVAEEARERGIEVVVLRGDQHAEELVADAVANGADAIGVAGGDGSLGLVAAAAVGHGVPFVCVPAGTRNHFALDAGLDPHDPLGALDAFTDGVERRVDVGEVNGRIFLNNVSLGVYGDAVRQDTYRDAKVRTLLETVRARLDPSGEARGLHVVDDLGREHADPAVLLVSNNPYALGPSVTPGGRPALDGGRLGVIVLDRPIPEPHAPGRAWSATRLEVQASVTLHAGIDGEAVDLSPPLRFATRPAALRMRVPAQQARSRRSRRVTQTV
jgi:diacylglycerol kinase family enzyme